MKQIVLSLFLLMLSGCKHEIQHKGEFITNVENALVNKDIDMLYDYFTPLLKRNVSKELLSQYLTEAGLKQEEIIGVKYAAATERNQISFSKKHGPFILHFRYYTILLQLKTGTYVLLWIKTAETAFNNNHITSFQLFEPKPMAKSYEMHDDVFKKHDR